MLSSIKFNPNITNISYSQKKCSSNNSADAGNLDVKNKQDVTFAGKNHFASCLVNPLTSSSDLKMMDELKTIFSSSKEYNKSPIDGKSYCDKLEELSRKGILSDRNSNDNSSALENIYKTATTERTCNFDSLKIAGQIIDAIYKPAIINQHLGNMPDKAKDIITEKTDIKESEIAQDFDSGTCVAASLESHMARQLPAEFARCVQAISSEERSVEFDVNLSSLIQNNTLYSIWLLKEFDVLEEFDFKSAKIRLKPDDAAYFRAKIQDEDFDRGERSIIDVLMQSTLMNTGAQNTYDSIKDTVDSKFNSNSKGLIEFEKTFIESIVENKEKTSVIYQNVDENKILHGSNCKLSDIEKHLTGAVDEGCDVIIGYVLTAKDCNEENQYDPNQIVNGHEITVVDYRKDANGNTIFICNDTDDDVEDYIEYSADYLLPKIHHASYLTDVIEKIDKNALQ